MKKSEADERALEIARAIERLESALPAREFAAVSAWVSTFFDFQKVWLLDWRKLACLNKCRQIGGSHTFAAWVVLHALLGEDCVIVSKTEVETKDLLLKCKKHLRVLESLGSDWARQIRSTATEVTIESGALIRATTSTAAGRGFSGNVFIDEAAYFLDFKAVWDAALAATTHGYSCRICSTPNGVGDLWHQLCTELARLKPSSFKQWRLYMTTIHDAIADGMDIDLENAWETALHDERIFNQLYMGVFIDGDLQYIPYELIKRATVDHEHDTYAECYAGLDIGESRDRTVLVIIHGDPRKGYQVSHCETHKRTDNELLQALIDKAFNVYGAVRLCVDSTGMGTFPASEARKKHGPKLEPVQFTNKSKEEMAGRTYQAFADSMIRIPRQLCDGEAPAMRDDIAAIRRIVTTAGNVRFDAPRTDKGHADRAWSLMLALEAASQAGHKGAYQRAKIRASRFMNHDEDVI